MIGGRKLNQIQTPLVIKIKTCKAVLKMIRARKTQMEPWSIFLIVHSFLLAITNGSNILSIKAILIKSKGTNRC